MLRTIIQTQEEGTGKELPIPADLLDRVQRAAGILEQMLHKVGEKFDIEARWWFEPRKGDFAVFLGLTGASGEVLTSEFPVADLGDDDSIRRWLWTPTGTFVNILSEELDRYIADIFRGIYAALEEWRNEDAGEIAQPADRGTLQTNP